MNETWLGILAGICTSASMLPQLIKVIKEKEADGISWFTLLLLILGTGAWSYYGFLKNDLPIIITNLFAVSVNLVLTFFYFKHKD